MTDERWRWQEYSEVMRQRLADLAEDCKLQNRMVDRFYELTNKELENERRAQ